MTMQAVRSRHAAATLDVAARLRSDEALTLPREVRRDIWRLVEAGLPQTAAHTLDTHLAAQAVAV